MTHRIIKVPITSCAAQKRCIQLPFGLALPFSDGAGAVRFAQAGCAFLSTCVVFSSRAEAAAIALLDAVSPCEGRRPAAATLPRCGSGCVAARAGKALAARRGSSCAAQCASGAAVPAVLPDAACAAHPGKPTHTAASSNGMFIFSSIACPF
jgi:hypothetical protein